MKHSLMRRLGIGGVMLLVASAALAKDSASVASGVIHGCVDASGRLRIVRSERDCRRDEAALSWQEQGPIGPQGLPGGVALTFGASAFDWTVNTRNADGSAAPSQTAHFP